MYRKIVVACDGSEQNALQECVRLAPPPQTEIHLLVVATVHPVVLASDFGVAAIVTPDEEQRAKLAMERVLEQGRQTLLAAGIASVPHLKIGEPAQIIAALAERLGADLVIVGHSHKKGFSLRWWRGTTDAVLTERLRCSLLIAAER